MPSGAALIALSVIPKRGNMRFDKKYPDAKHDDELEECMCYFDIPDICIMCWEPSHFVELNFEAALCSEECRDKLYKEYDEACMKVLESENLMPDSPIYPSNK